MILNNLFLSQMLSEDEQKKEITRLKNASVGSVVFQTTTFENTDVQETLLHKAQVGYVISVANGNARFVKTK